MRIYILTDGESDYIIGLYDSKKLAYNAMLDAVKNSINDGGFDENEIIPPTFENMGQHFWGFYIEEFTLNNTTIR